MPRKKYATTDFSTDKMPHNRVQVFFDVLKLRFSTLMSAGALLFLFALPLMVVTVMRNLKVSEANLIVDEAERATAVFQTVNFFNFISVAAWAVAGLGFSGLFAVVRKLVWQRGILFFYDFFKGVKDNAVAFSVYFAVAAALNYLVQRCLRQTFFDDGLFVQAAVIASVAAAALYAPTMSFSLVQSTVYDLGITKKFVNSFLISMRTAYTVFPVAVLNLAPLTLLFIPNTVVFGVFLIVLPLIFAPLIALFDTLYCDALLDKYINKDNFPEIVDRGIYRNAQNNDD